MREDLLSQFVKTKKKAKKGLCEKLSFNCGMPLVGLVIDNELDNSQKNIIEKFLEGTAALDIEIVVVADTNLDSFSFPHVHFVPYSEKNRKEIIGASDIMIALPFNDVEEMLFNGAVPVCNENPIVSDYNPNSEAGNAFIYGDIGNSQNTAHYKIFASLVRALETFRFPYDWKNIILSGLESTKKI